MRGSVTAHLLDGAYAGAFVQVEATDGTPASRLYFALVGDRVRPMPREDVDRHVLQEAYGHWHLYGRDADEPFEDAWRYSSLPAAAHCVRA